MRKKILTITLLLVCLVSFSQEKDDKTKDPYHITNLNVENYDDWQLALGSQNYQTNYGVYVQFRLNPVTGKREFKFKIINYKGIIPLGIKDIILDEDPHNGKKNIYIHVQGLNKTRETKYYEYFDSIIIDEIVIAERVLIPMFIKRVGGEADDKDIYATRTLKQWNGQKKEITIYATATAEIERDDINMLNLTSSEILDAIHGYNSIIDTEFFYVDGEKHRIPIDNYDTYGDSEKLAGLRCRFGNNKIKN